jgi:hypothetical protein
MKPRAGVAGVRCADDQAGNVSWCVAYCVITTTLAYVIALCTVPRRRLGGLGKGYSFTYCFRGLGYYFVSSDASRSEASYEL